MVGILLNATIGEKGQVVIPKPIRDQFGLEPNTGVYFIIENGRVIIVPESEGKKTFDDFINAIPKRKLPAKIDWDAEYYGQFG